jgi:hypothetical protein
MLSFSRVYASLSCLLSYRLSCFSASSFALFLRSLPSLSSFALFLRSLPSLSSFALFLRSLPSLSSFALFLRPLPSLSSFASPSIINDTLIIFLISLVYLCFIHRLLSFAHSIFILSLDSAFSTTSSSIYSRVADRPLHHHFNIRQAF